MKKIILCFFILTYLYYNLYSYWSNKLPYWTSQTLTYTGNVSEKEAAYLVLEHKCNSCHRKKNPFRVFSLKNMNKNASRINKQVFEYKRMPKGDTVLTTEEYATLKNWIQSLTNN